MIIVRTYMQGLPEEIIEVARIDGANDLIIFVKIVIPFSAAVIATIGLFYAVGHWNNYFGPMIFLMDRDKYPLQLLLKEMIVNEDMQGMFQGARDALRGTKASVTSNILVCATMIIAMLPILCVYPFIQKYFVKGVMIGAVKG